MSNSPWPLAAACVLAFGVTLAAQPAKTPDKTPDKTTDSSLHPKSISEVGGRSYALWLDDLKARDASKRADAIVNLLGFGEGAADAVPAVLDRLQDGDVSVRTKAVLFLKVVTVRDKDKVKVVEALARSLGGSATLPRDPQAIVRYDAATALLRFAEDGKPAVNALLVGLKDSACWEIRQASVIALRRAAWDTKAGPDPRASRALLDVLTQDPVERVKLEATISLGAMGRPPEPRLLADVVQALQLQGKTRDKPIRLWSHVSLVLLDDAKGAEKSLAEIRELMRSPEREVRLQCLLALGALGTKARPCIPDVLGMLEDKEKEVIGAAISVLPALDDHGPRVLNPLIKITKGSEQPLVYMACAALGEIGVAQPDVMDALTAVTQRKELETQLRQAVEKVVDKLKHPPPPKKEPKDRDR